MRKNALSGSITQIEKVAKGQRVWRVRGLAGELTACGSFVGGRALSDGADRISGGSPRPRRSSRLPTSAG